MLCWVKERPNDVGKYWCRQNNYSRIVSVWRYSSEPDGDLFTNEDGGCLLSDKIYDDALWWSEKIEPPASPKRS